MINKELNNILLLLKVTKIENIEDAKQAFILASEFIKMTNKIRVTAFEFLEMKGLKEEFMRFLDQKHIEDNKLIQN